MLLPEEVLAGKKLKSLYKKKNIRDIRILEYWQGIDVIVYSIHIKGGEFSYSKHHEIERVFFKEKKLIIKVMVRYL